MEPPYINDWMNTSYSGTNHSDHVYYAVVEESKVPRYPERPKLSENKIGYEKANGNKPARIPAPSERPNFATPVMQNQKYSPPDGKLKSQPVPDKAHTGTIDSNEAVKKYKGTKIPSDKAHTGTIDSNEAVKKYNGTTIPSDKVHTGTIDSNEAVKKYNSTKIRSDKAHTGIIDSNEVVKIYNGTKIP